MFTYQIRKRDIRFAQADPVSFPADGEVRFHFRPLQPFGMEGGGGHTAVRAVAASVLFNANNGQHVIESKSPLRPLDVRVQEGLRNVLIAGDVLTIQQRFDNVQVLSEVIESVYFGLPLLLNVAFADPPYVERVDGQVGASAFRWELSNWKARFQITEQEVQELKAAKAWERMGVLSHADRRRLIAALHYFHVACRLARAGATVGEFVAEVILNLAKSLEALFPADEGKGRDAVRRGLAALGFSKCEVESNFLPAIALRNEIDVGHVYLALFKMDQLSVIHAFTERAESAFRDLFDRILTKVEDGTFEVARHELGPATSKAVAVIKRLREHTPQDAL